MIKQKQISINETIVQIEGNIVSDMGGEKVMLSVKNGKYYNLGEIGGMIWDLLDHPISVKGITESLMGQYHVEQSECENQTLAFVEHLLQEGLVRIEK